MNRFDLLQLPIDIGLTSVPQKQRPRESPVWCGDGSDSVVEQVAQRLANPTVNIGVRCGENFTIMGCDFKEAFHNFSATHDPPSGCAVIGTARGYRIWVKPQKPIRSQLVNNVEIKRLGSHMLSAPQSILPVSLRLPGCLSAVRDFTEAYRIGLLKSALPFSDTAMMKIPTSLEVTR